MLSMDPEEIKNPDNENESAGNFQNSSFSGFKGSWKLAGLSMYFTVIKLELMLSNVCFIQNFKWSIFIKHH